MKKAILPGFSAYVIFNNGTIQTTDGKTLSANSKGKFKLVASENAEGIEAGKSYSWTHEEISAAIGDTWEDVPAATPEAAAPPAAPVVLTPEQIAENERKAKLTQLKKAVKEAKDKLILAPLGEETDKAKEALMAANKALEEFEEANKPKASAEEIAAREAYDIVKADFTELEESYKAAKERLKNAAEAVKPFGKVDGVSVDSRAPHMSYEIAQRIRRDYSVGRYGNPGEQETIKAIAERYGCVPQSVVYKVNYIQNKLQTLNTTVTEDGLELNKAYTPLVNEYYGAESGFPNGAPLAHEGVTEGWEKYLKGKAKVEYLAKKAAEAKAEADAKAATQAPAVTA